MYLSDCHHSKFIINPSLDGTCTYICKKCMQDCEIINHITEKFKGIEDGNQRIKEQNI